MLAGLSAGARRAGARALSEHYRDGGRSDATIDLGAYLTVRLPATYAAVTSVLTELRTRRPAFAPASMLDAGSGPGTASWAAAAAWPGLTKVSMIDSNREFLALAGAIAAESPLTALSDAQRNPGQIERITGENAADLVIAAYALAEIPDNRLDRAVAALWQAAAGMLVLVEPGTPAGFGRILKARKTLLGAGAVPVAPCPHAGECPVTGSDWCHFRVRLSRSRAHMHAKAAQVPFEDEKFAYLIVSRTGAVSNGARVLAPPRLQKPSITFKLCTDSGMQHRVIARRDGAAYKIHRKRVWGDLLD